MHSTQNPNFCKLCRSPGHSNFQASVARSVGKILEEEAEAALNLLDALPIKSFEDAQESRKNRGQTVAEHDSSCDVVVRDLEISKEPESKKELGAALELEILEGTPEVKRDEDQTWPDSHDDIVIVDLGTPECEEIKGNTETVVGQMRKSFARASSSAPSPRPVGLGISEASKQTIPATLLTLAPEIHSRIFDILKNDRVASLCLGLTCKTFYQLYWSLHGKLGIHNICSLECPPGMSPNKYITQQFDSADMMHCVNHFLPKNTFFSFTSSKWMSLDRRIELRDERVKKKLENAKRLKALEDKDVSLSRIWKKTYGDGKVGFLGDESDDDIEDCR